MDIIDLRSDTVTKPSAAMRQVIAKAKVGDDVFEEDPTVQQLEEMAAQLLKKPAALFTSSGTLSNLIASILWNPPGSEMITEARSHVVLSEAGGTARFAGSQIRTIETASGILTAEDILKNIRSHNIHYPKTTSVFIENTHNMAGGKCYSLPALKKVYQTAKKHHLNVHLDGARIFNASIATGVNVHEITRYADSVSFCLSKGLGCPMGAILTGTTEFILEARRLRKALGGGLRQIGMMAAAGIYALKNNIERLEQDHLHAKWIAQVLQENHCQVETPETNIILWNTQTNAATISEDLKKAGILTIPINAQQIRLVTHLDISTSDVKIVLEKLGRYLIRHRKTI